MAVFSEEFRTAIDAWTELHGFRAGEVLVAHPIQPLDDDEVRALADTAYDAILEQLTTPAATPAE